MLDGTSFNSRARVLPSLAESWVSMTSRTGEFSRRFEAYCRPSMAIWSACERFNEAWAGIRGPEDKSGAGHRVSEDKSGTGPINTLRHGASRNSASRTMSIMRSTSSRTAAAVGWWNRV